MGPATATYEEKGKGKIVSMLGLEKKDADVLPLGLEEVMLMCSEEAWPSTKESKQTEEMVTY